jgi:hypothetical protein
MQPITVKSQMALNDYLSFNFYLLLRKLYLKILGAVFLLIVLWVIISGEDIKNYYTPLGILILYAFILPLIVYLSAIRNFKKIKTISELKIYQFDDEGLQVSSETVNFSSKWSPIEKAKERKSDFLLLTSNGRAVHYLLKVVFKARRI